MLGQWSFVTFEQATLISEQTAFRQLCIKCAADRRPYGSLWDFGRTSRFMSARAKVKGKVKSTAARVGVALQKPVVRTLSPGPEGAVKELWCVSIAILNVPTECPERAVSVFFGQI
jgi:hypothetical protein